MLSVTVSVAPETLFHIGPVAVNNSMTTALLVTGAIILLAIYAKATFKLIPTRLQLILELCAEFILTQLQGAFGSESKARKFFPLLMSLLLFIFIANQITVVPLVGQIVLGDTPVFRTTTSHLTAPVAMAIVTLAVAHIIAFSIAPLRHIGNFIKIAPFFKIRSFGDFGNALMEFMLGIMDIIGELAKLLSLSFRLFGNVFAGELMIAVIAGLTSFTRLFVPVPFMALSIFSGLVQAFVFTMLAVQFISGTIMAVSNTKEEEVNLDLYEKNRPRTPVPVRVES
jgi:F-type H+-transporting ATPase subunit a